MTLFKVFLPGEKYNHVQAKRVSTQFIGDQNFFVSQLSQISVF